MLYYENQYRKEFKSKIIKQEVDEAGNRYVVLKETTFYPTGGGQPNDTGRLNDVPVVNVEEVEGEIRHYVTDKIIPNDKGQVYGVIDWNRRFDHMQQHAGQHILSAVFEQLYDIKTVGFHLGSQVVTIDLDTNDLTAKMSEAVERKANQVILENRAIEAKWVTEAELSKYPLRKRPTVTDNIRLVIISDFDYNGCGGTHPQSTGEVLGIKLLRWERQRKKVRLEFVCGNRVLQQLGEKQKVMLQLTQLLSCPQEKMIDTVERFLAEKKALDLALTKAKDELLTVEAEQLARGVQLINNQAVIQQVFQNRTITSLQKLARIVIGEVDDVVIFFVNENEQQLQIVAARGQNVPYNLKEVGKKIFPLIEGRGGGKEDFIQGGGNRTMTAQDLLYQLHANTIGK